MSDDMSGHRYKARGWVGFFDQERRLRKISKLGNPLERLEKVIDFEMFREELEINMLNLERKNNSGCKPYDVVSLFKIILLKRFYNFSDEQAEFQIKELLFKYMQCYFYHILRSLNSYILDNS